MVIVRCINCFKVYACYYNRLEFCYSCKLRHGCPILPSSTIQNWGICPQCKNLGIKILAVMCFVPPKNKKEEK